MTPDIVLYLFLAIYLLVNLCYLAIKFFLTLHSRNFYTIYPLRPTKPEKFITIHFSHKGHGPRALGPTALGVTLKLFITIPHRDPSEKLSFYRIEYLKYYKMSQLKKVIKTVIMSGVE